MDIPYYLELQRRVFDALRYVSCHESNFETYSIIFESLIIDTCSFFDSICQTLIRERSLTEKQQAKANDLYGEVQGSETFNFGDYRRLLENNFLLSRREVNLNPYEGAECPNPLSHGPDAICGHIIVPFKEWAAGTSSPWWRAFTDLKHDRIGNFREATLRNVIYSMASVFIILTVRNEDQFKAGSVPPEIYDLFFPKYWGFKGRVAMMNFLWS